MALYPALEIIDDAALAIIDYERCFIPAEEGEHLNQAGFGELPVPNAQNLLRPLNELTMVFDKNNLVVVTTGDAHKLGTAHFSEEPNFIDTWPIHGVEGTAGAELHPGLIAGYGVLALHFIKGDVVAASPAEDNSYTGALAHRTDEQSSKEVLLPDYLRDKGVNTAILGGVALGDGDQHPLCVDSTARDFHEQGFKVIVVTDAVEAVLPENREICFRNLAKLGIQLATTQEVITTISDTRQ